MLAHEGFVDLVDGRELGGMSPTSSACFISGGRVRDESSLAPIHIAFDLLGIMTNLVSYYTKKRLGQGPVEDCAQGGRP